VPSLEIRFSHVQSLFAQTRTLCAALGDSHRAIKVTMRWTGAGERTVKNWFAGRNGPNGQHLVELLRRSDEVLRFCFNWPDETKFL